ncbi:hypothetical protein ACWD6U_44155, partial [Streptomyces sp. NPDC005149]
PSRGALPSAHHCLPWMPRCAAAHLPVTLDVTPGVPHVFQGFTGILDDADAALTRIGTFLRSHLAVK